MENTGNNPRTQGNASSKIDGRNIFEHTETQYQGYREPSPVLSQKTMLGKKFTHTKLLVFMDSNRKYINQRKFWTIDGTPWKWTPYIRDVVNQLNEEVFNDVECILISVGCNDTDSKNGNQVHNELIECTV